jgi:hypothetical protein
MYNKCVEIERYRMKMRGSVDWIQMCQNKTLMNTQLSRVVSVPTEIRTE